VLLDVAIRRLLLIAHHTLGWGAALFDSHGFVADRHGRRSAGGPPDSRHPLLTRSAASEFSHLDALRLRARIAAANRVPHRRRVLRPAGLACATRLASPLRNLFATRPSASLLTLGPTLRPLLPSLLRRLRATPAASALWGIRGLIPALASSLRRVRVLLSAGLPVPHVLVPR
jgi:hypothetical protein